MTSCPETAIPFFMITAVIQVPYDSGQRERRMGCGPAALLRRGAVDRAAAAGGEAVAARIDTDEAFPGEIAVAFDLARKLSGEVARARRQGAFPLVLAGNCISAVGTLAGLADVPRLGVVWLDAHGDMNTPETTESGFLDGMALAVAGGHCWQQLAARIPGFRAIPGAATLHLGAQVLDPGEADLMLRGAIATIPGPELRAKGAAAIGEALERLAREVDAVYLHLDMDVHASAEAKANAFALPDGPTPQQVRAIVEAVVQRLPVVAAGLAAYDPEHDRTGSTADAALSLIEALVRSVAARR